MYGKNGKIYISHCQYTIYMVMYCNHGSILEYCSCLLLYASSCFQLVHQHDYIIDMFTYHSSKGVPPSPGSMSSAGETTEGEQRSDSASAGDHIHVAVRWVPSQ